MIDSIRKNAVPCDHSPVGCQACREERAAKASERPSVTPIPPTKGTVDMLLMMLDTANRELRDQAAAIGRLNTENKQLREQLQELRTKQRKRRAKK